MRFAFLLSYLSLVCIANGQNVSAYDYSYSANGIVYVYSVPAKKAVMVNKETDPYISPDGTKLAYTALSPNGDRHVEIIDLASKQKTVLATKNDNCYRPVWSPDGQWIVYNAFINATWHTCIIDKENHNPILITKMFKDGSGTYSPTWSADSRKILVHNMESLFTFDKDGVLLDKTPISGLAEVTDITSDSKFILSKDESKIIFNCSVNEQGFDGPPAAIFVYDKKTKTTKRISPKGYWFFQPFLKGERIYFSGSKKGSEIDNVYSSNLDGSDFKTEMTNRTDYTSTIDQ